MYRCTGCGSTESIEEIRKLFPGAISCCPERKMEQVLIDDAMVSRALSGFDCGTGDPNDYKRRMRFALEAALECSTANNSN